MDPLGTIQPVERPRKINVKKVKEEKKEDEPIHPYFVVPSWKQDEKLWELPLDVEPLLNVFTFGWTEDGRCGYPPPHPSHIQIHPHPVYELRQPINRKTGEQYVCRAISAGNKHSVFIMMNIRPDLPPPEGEEFKRRHDVSKRKKKKIVITGLNQLMLCEEPGFHTPQELDWEDPDDEPTQVFAGNGNTFILTRFGCLYSFGTGKFGMLGHGEERSSQVPRQILALRRAPVAQVAIGLWHVMILTEDGRIFSWGRNNVGQLGRGEESLMELMPEEINFFKGTKESGDTLLQIGCGAFHSFVLMSLRRRKGKPEERRLYMWGDNSRGQCGNAEEERRMFPQENAYLSNFCSKKKLMVKQIVAGSYHCLALTEPSGQIVSWGAGDYGQLGLGSQFDESIPRVIAGVRNVIRLSAGARHNMCLCDVSMPDPGGDGKSRNFGTSAFDLYSWGYNGYGELGLSDVNIRLSPTKLTCFRNARILDVACGDRHSVVLTVHKPMTNNESHLLKPFFNVLEESNSEMARSALKIIMKKKELDPDLLDHPKALLPEQTGEYDDPVKNEFFEKGLRYCMDSTRDPSDWRRGSLECAFECITPTKPPRHLKTICLSCARHCHPNAKLMPYARRRTKKDYRCDCRTSGMCLCTYSFIRGAFDALCGEDFKIGPNNLRSLLITLRKPEPVEKENMDDCLAYFATASALAKAAAYLDSKRTTAREEDEDSDDDAAYDALEQLTEPRIGPIQFEKWFREYFDIIRSDSENEEEDDKW